MVPIKIYLSSKAISFSVDTLEDLKYLFGAILNKSDGFIYSIEIGDRSSGYQPSIKELESIWLDLGAASHDR